MTPSQAVRTVREMKEVPSRRLVRYCHRCRQERVFEDTTPGPLGALFFTLISFGLYLIPLILTLVFPDKRNLRCPTCREMQDVRGNVLGNWDESS